MAKSKRNRRRDSSNITRRSLPPVRLVKVSFPKSLNLTQLEDRRTWHPEGPRRPARMRNSYRHRLRAVQTPKTRQYQATRAQNKYREDIGFVTPNKVFICIRRKIRQQVLHALRKTGKVGQKRPRWTEYSTIKC